jgi:purine-binding chemotaxis protein CheW
MGELGMTDQYIVFTLAGTAYAVPTSQVAHVEMVEEVTRVPNAPAYVDGIVFSRGAVVPAMNLRARFGFERAPYDTRTRLLIVQAAGRTVGLVVDSAREFQSIAASAIVPPGAGLSGLSGSYLRGIATIGDRLIMVLDLEGLLEATDLQAPTAVASPPSQELQ